MYNVLVCDDEKDIVSALRIYLMSEGYQVFEAFKKNKIMNYMGNEEDYYESDIRTALQRRIGSPARRCDLPGGWQHCHILRSPEF